MRYAGSEPAIAVHSVNSSAVNYSPSTSGAFHSLSATTLQPAAHKCTAVRPASIPWFRLFNR